jgi:hypothetical protein
MVPDSSHRKINDNASEKSKFKSTLDIESHDSHKLKSDNNLATSASFKEIPSEKNFPLKELWKVKSFHKDETDNYALSEVIDKKQSNENHFQLQSPISKHIDNTTEMENDNIQNISNLIETDEIRINSGEVTHNITSFDNDKEKVPLKVEEQFIQFGDKDEGETDISTKKVPLANYMQVLYDQNSERLKKRSQQMRKMKEKLNIVGEAGNTIKESSSKKSNETKSRVPSSNKVFKEKEENLKESILEQAINSQPKEVKNDDTELVISDLDCPIEEDLGDKIDQTNNKHVKNSLSMNLPGKSFIQITNNLLIKSHAKQDNATSDYLLALNQCATQQEEDPDKNDSKSEANEKHKRFPSVNSF